MKSKLIRWLLLGALLNQFTGDARAIDPVLGRFMIAKQQQIRDFAETITNKVPPIVWRFYDAVRVDDWQSATNFAQRINRASHRYADTTNDDAITPALGTVIWQPICESYGAYEQFHGWNNQWLHRYGDAIIQSIPPGSIYFGGTDPGRFVISVMSESQVTGKPFFILTQNQLADQTYLDYLRSMYGRKIKLPTVEDSQKAFEDYTADVEKRRKLGQLKPGEDAQMVDGKIQISGQVSVMEINALLVKQIFDLNPDREFFIEESFPLDWMFPYLAPHGLIFQLNRRPLTELPGSEIAKSQSYWKKLCDEQLGNWLDEKTTLKDICAFAVKYGDGEHLENYPGDKTFAANAQARKCYSKLCSAQAGLYAWRYQQSKDHDERDRLFQAADLAFRQSYALCPYSPEALYRYINLLFLRNRTEDAILLAQTTLRITPDDKQIKNLVNQLKQYRQ